MFQYTKSLNSNEIFNTKLIDLSIIEEDEIVKIKMLWDDIVHHTRSYWQ